VPLFSLLVLSLLSTSLSMKGSAIPPSLAERHLIKASGEEQSIHLVRNRSTQTFTSNVSPLVRNSLPSSSSLLIHSLSAAFAGGVSAFVTSPLDMAKLRLQVSCSTSYPPSRTHLYPCPPSRSKGNNPLEKKMSHFHFGKLFWISIAKKVG
jgi:hypothetical protein